MAVEQRADLQRRIGAQQGNHLARLLRVRERLGGLVPQPRNNRDPVVTEHKKRIMGVSNNSCELLLKDMIQKADDLFFVKLSHSSFLSVDRALGLPLLTPSELFCSQNGLRPWRSYQGTSRIWPMWVLASIRRCASAASITTFLKKAGAIAIFGPATNIPVVAGILSLIEQRRLPV
jgi:hypothetical protein